MPRIRVKASSGDECIVGTPKCSILTVTLIARAQRSTLELRADARLLGGEDTLEHSVWEFDELPAGTRIELIAESGHTYDPPDRSETRTSKPLEIPAEDTPDILAIERELVDLKNALSQIQMRKARESCAFCGRHKDEVLRLIAGPLVMICGDCVDSCKELLSGEAGAV